MVGKISNYFPAPLVLFAFLLSFIVIYSVGNPILGDYDMGWHIAAGDLIRSTGNISPSDPWGFSGNRETWHNHSWLWDILLSIVHQLGGIQGVFIFSVICPALLTALVVSSLRSRGGIGVNALVFTAFLFTYSVLEFATGRPQVAGMFFALAFFHILHKSRNNPKSLSLFFLPIIMVLWANIHGSFFAGLIAIGAYGIEAIISRNNLWFRSLFLIGFLCLLATFMTPYGFGLFLFIAETQKSVITQYIREWQPFVFGSVIGASLWLLAFVFFGNMRANNSFIADKILAVLWLLAMLFSVRNVGIMAIFAAPYIAANLPPDDEKDKHTRNLSAWIYNLRYSPVIMLCSAIILTICYYVLPLLGDEHYIDKKDKSPAAAINYIMQNHVGERLLNDYDFGGRIIYESKGTIPIFIDGRANSVYSEEALSDYIKFLTLEDGWQNVIAKYNVNIMLLKNGRDFVKYHKKGLYNDEWKEVYNDDVASVYIRKAH